MDIRFSHLNQAINPDTSIIYSLWKKSRIFILFIRYLNRKFYWCAIFEKIQIFSRPEWLRNNIASPTLFARGSCPTGVYIRLRTAVQTGTVPLLTRPDIPTKKPTTRVSFFIGALGRNRTGTGLLPTDFKSAASTCSATSAYQS